MYTEVFIRQLGCKRYIGQLTLDEHAGYGLRVGDIFSAPPVWGPGLDGETRYKILSKEFTFMNAEKNQPVLQMEVMVAPAMRPTVQDSKLTARL